MVIKKNGTSNLKLKLLFNLIPFDDDGLVSCQESCIVSILPIYLKTTLQDSHASQLAGVKNKTELSSPQRISQHFEDVKVEI